MKRLVALCLLVLPLLSSAQKYSGFEKSLYQAFNLTAENLFSQNIEGPDVDAKGNLYVVNFQKDGTIGWVHADGSVEMFVSLPTGSVANAIKFDARGDMLLADYTGHNILKVDMNSKAVSVFCHNDQFNQPNDICLNKKGQIFASDPSWKNGNGKLWRIDPDGKATALNVAMGTTNGIELSPDDRILYVNESVQRKVWKFDVDDQGNLGNKTLLYEFSDFGMDGMKCDKDGNLYITRHGKGTVVILSPSGKLLHEVTLKGKGASNIVFGGKDGKTCYVTLQDRKAMEMFRSKVAGKKWK